jgi:hypothetical protein
MYIYILYILLYNIILIVLYYITVCYIILYIICTCVFGVCVCVMFMAKALSRIMDKLLSSHMQDCCFLLCLFTEQPGKLLVLDIYIYTDIPIYRYT